jgi:ribosomal protein L21E
MSSGERMETRREFRQDEGKKGKRKRKRWIEALKVSKALKLSKARS